MQRRERRRRERAEQQGGQVGPPASQRIPNAWRRGRTRAPGLHGPGGSRKAAARSRVRRMNDTPHPANSARRMRNIAAGCAFRDGRGLERRLGADPARGQPYSDRAQSACGGRGRRPDVARIARTPRSFGGPAISVFTSLPTLLFGLFAPVAPLLSRRIGTERALLVGSDPADPGDARCVASAARRCCSRARSSRWPAIGVLNVLMPGLDQARLPEPDRAHDRPLHDRVLRRRGRGGRTFRPACPRVRRQLEAGARASGRSRRRLLSWSGPSAPQPGWPWSGDRRSHVARHLARRAGLAAAPVHGAAIRARLHRVQLAAGHAA